MHIHYFYTTPLIDLHNSIFISDINFHLFLSDLAYMYFMHSQYVFTCNIWRCRYILITFLFFISFFFRIYDVDDNKICFGTVHDDTCSAIHWINPSPVCPCAGRLRSVCIRHSFGIELKQNK